MITTVASLALFLAILLPSPSCGRGAGDVYLICSGSYTTLARAEERASAMQKSGGGGFVRWDGQYYVYSAAYVSESDCDAVLAKLGSGHEKAVLSVSEYSDVSRCTKKFGELFYALDGGKADADSTIKKLSEFSNSETFFENVKDEQKRTKAANVFANLKKIGSTDLGAKIKYYQLELVCIFAAQS